MNLKTVARRLGVHYQTAYRYVRAGDLVAVKVGGSYKISEAALEMLRQRLAAADAPMRLEVQHPPTPGEALEDELDTMLHSTSLSAQPVFDLATRWLAMEVGDVCILRLLSEDGQYAPAVSFFDRDPARRGLLAAYMAASLPKLSELPAAVLIEENRVLVEHHMEAPKVSAAMAVRFRQYAQELQVQSMASCPVRTRSGDPIGALTLLRRPGARPFSADEVELLRELAAKVEDAVARVERFSAAWVARDELYESVGQLFSLDDILTPAAVTDQLMDLADGPAPQAIFDVNRHLVVASDSFLELFAAGAPTGDVDEAPFVGCAHCEMTDLWEQLLSGISDFIVNHCEQCDSLVRAQVGIHWVVVRRPDGTPVAVVAVCESGPQPALTAVA
jgi:excisionase family DNA binding protein